MSKADLEGTYRQLRELLEKHAPGLVVVHDTAEHFYLDTAHVMKNRKSLFFGAVRIMKQHVSYHLMPMYMWPDMLEQMSPALRTRMQGKSCFNFRDAEPELLSELRELTDAGYRRYREHGYVP